MLKRKLESEQFTDEKLRRFFICRDSATSPVLKERARAFRYHGNFFEGCIIPRIRYLKPDFFKDEDLCLSN